MTETVEKTATGAIVYDKAIINQISDARFTSEGWPHAELLTGSLRSGGRGRTMFVGNVPRQFVLRHYVRGGLIGKLVNDLYVFSVKTERARSWSGACSTSSPRTTCVSLDLPPRGIVGAGRSTRPTSSPCASRA